MVVVEETKKAWVVRMRTLLELLEDPTILLWIGRNPPDGLPGEYTPGQLDTDPLFVNQTMVDTLSPLVTIVKECTISKTHLVP